MITLNNSSLREREREREQQKKSSRMNQSWGVATGTTFFSLSFFFFLFFFHSLNKTKNSDSFLDGIMTAQRCLLFPWIVLSWHVTRMITAKQDRQNMTVSVSRAAESAHCQHGLLFLCTIWRKKRVVKPPVSHRKATRPEFLVNRDYLTRDTNLYIQIKDL